MNFVEILPIHIKTCKNIIESEGNCFKLRCYECPFTWFNAPNRIHCKQNGYSTTLGNLKDNKKVESAKRFLELVGDDNIGL